jgi:hypothetical protein
MLLLATSDKKVVVTFSAWHDQEATVHIGATPNEEVDNLQTCIQKMIAQLQVYYPYNKGSG